MRIRMLCVIAVLALLQVGCATGSAVTVTVVQTPTAQPTATAIPAGSISGHLGYPSSGIPPLAVYAISTTNSSVYFQVNTTQNQTTYTITQVTPGTYHVVAYLVPDKPTLRGGYSQYVVCGNAAGCPSHALVDVNVHAGETVSKIDPTDWYADQGTFPDPPH